MSAVEYIRITEPPRRVLLAEILQAVCAVSGIDVAAVRGPSLKRQIVIARRAYCALARELTAASYTRIAMTIGRTDHTTILHHCRWAAERGCAATQQIIAGARAMIAPGCFHYRVRNGGAK